MLDTARGSRRSALCLKHQASIIRVHSAKPLIEQAQAPRANYTAPTLNLLLVQRTETGAGLLNEGVAFSTSKIVD